MRFSTKFGLKPIEQQTLYLAMGAGKPLMYSSLGFQAAHLFRRDFDEKRYRPLFFELTRRGLITYVAWEDLGKMLHFRKVKPTARTAAAIADIEIRQGGDYAFFHYYDPYEDYSKHPERLDRFGGAPRKMKPLPHQRKRYLPPGLTYDSRAESSAISKTPFE
jgi:hypothetical protein